jgi:hypothetical protein
LFVDDDVSGAHLIETRGKGGLLGEPDAALRAGEEHELLADGV